MRAYYISPEVDSVRRRLLRTLFFTAFSVAVFVLIDRVLLRRQIELVDLAVVAIISVASPFWSKPQPGFDLEVDDTEIRIVREGSIKRKVLWERIRYVRERSGSIFRRPMLIISEHGSAATRFLGCIAVPKSLPEYEQIKTQVLGWLENPGR